MIFIRLNCSFRRINAMIVRFHELVITVLRLQVCFNRLGGLVVRHIERRLESFFLHLRKHILERPDNRLVGHISYRDGKNIVRVVIIRNKVVLVAVQGPGR